MADYPILAPTIAALDGTKTDPADAESASQLAAVDRQTRNWLVDFLSTIVDPTTGKLLSSGFDTSSLPTGGTRGSTANAGTQREILQGSVSDVDIRDLAVTTAKLAALAVTSAKLADDAVTSAKIATGAVVADGLGANAVETAAVKDAAITAVKLATDAVESAKIKDSAVTSAKIAANAVTSDKMISGSAAQIMLHNGTAWVATTISGSLSINSSGVTTLSVTGSSVGFVRVSEKVAAGTHGGASTAGSWAQKRGVATSWSIDEQSGGTTVNLGAAGLINIQANGVYLVTVVCPAYSVGLHKIKATFTPVSGSAVEYVGSTECAPAGAMTSSRLYILLTVTGASAGTPATLSIAHYTELAKATNGLGIALNATEVERYAMVEMLRVSS